MAELLVVLAVLSLLTAMAIPFAENTVQRRKELALKETLRDVREAIDHFQDDWHAGLFREDAQGISENGLPVTLDVLVDGLDDQEGNFLRYLRRLPENPFAKSDAEFEDQWRLLGYADAEDADRWNEVDVYDLRAKTERIALDGSDIANW